jgi:hypothetical protein
MNVLPDDADAPHDLLSEIIRALERRGVDRDEYKLYDTVDVEALERLRDSAAEQIEVRFTVEGVHLEVTATDVRALGEE